MPRTTEHSLPFNKGIFHFSYRLKPVGKALASVVILVCTGKSCLKLKVTPHHSVAYPEA